MRSKYKSDLRVHTAAALVRVRTLIDMSRHVDTRRHVVARSPRSVARVLQVHGWTLALPFKAFNAQQETSARSLARARAQAHVRSSSCSRSPSQSISPLLLLPTRRFLLTLCPPPFPASSMQRLWGAAASGRSDRAFAPPKNTNPQTSRAHN